jgi:peptidoglycan hydrolase-like protein with peptidoglycan-binding domain
MRPSIVLAASRLTSLPAWAEQQLSYVQPLPPEAVQSVQERLRQSRTFGGAIDGIWGLDSQSALERFQRSHQLQVTGQLNEATAATLGLDPHALLTTTAGMTAPPPPSALRPSSVQTIQFRLRSLGFYNGAVDGIWGPATEDAILRYQQVNSLQPNGQPNPATVSAMGLAPDVLAYR